MHATRQPNVKMLAAIIGGSAVVAAGAGLVNQLEQLGHDGRRNQYPGNTAHRARNDACGARREGHTVRRRRLLDRTFHLRSLRLPKTAEGLKVDPSRTVRVNKGPNGVGRREIEAVMVLSATAGTTAVSAMGALTVTFSDVSGAENP